MRADAQHNRQSILAAADALIRERGIDVPVAEIADAAGVGRATLFRNFATKEDLLVAVVVSRMDEFVEDARALLESADGDDADLAFELIEDLVTRQQQNRALMEAVSEIFMHHEEVKEAHLVALGLIDAALERGKKVGAVRPEVGSVDVILLVKGLCMASDEFPVGSELMQRHLALVRAALTTSEHQRPIPGPPPTPGDLERELLAQTELDDERAVAL